MALPWPMFVVIYRTAFTVYMAYRFNQNAALNKHTTTSFKGISCPGLGNLKGKDFILSTVN
jgi:hypothetical protein